MSVPGKAESRRAESLHLERKRRLEQALEWGLEDSFPASDPVSVTEPASTRPNDDYEATVSHVHTIARRPGRGHRSGSSMI